MAFGKTKFLLTVSAIVAAVPAMAQSATDGGDTAENELAGDIVVTAQRRSENLMKTSLSADVLTQETLTNKGVSDLESLQFATPSLSVALTGITSNVNLRGIGLGVSDPDVVPGIAVYRDGMFQPPILSSEPLFDMAAVEVLRGPQGTIVGSSSTGGAIFYRSVDPKIGETGGRIQASLGNYNNYGFQAAVNLPISDTMAARVAFNYDDRDSFYEHSGSISGSPKRSIADPGNLSQKNLRVGLLWKPSENFTALAKFAYNKNDTDGLAHIPSAANVGFRGISFDTYYNVLDTSYDELGKRGILQLDYETDGGLTFRSISGHSDIHVNYVDDFDSNSLIDSTFTNNARERTTTQEFNIISPTGGNFDWIFGGYYFNDIVDLELPIDTPNAFPTRVFITQSTTKKALAAFGQIGYKLTPALQIQIGARYTSSKAKVEGPITLFGLAPFPIVIPGDARQSDDGFTGKVALNWTINPDHYAYAFAAKGAKAGGINGVAPAPNFAPESIYDYEVGLKSTWLGGLLRSELNAFYMKYSSIQLTSYIPPSGPITSGAFAGINGVVNGGGATIKGFEAQIQARSGGFGFDAGLSYVDTSLSQTLFINAQLLPNAGVVPLGPQCPAGTANNPPVCFNYGPATTNFAGRPLPYAPKLTFTAGVDYEFELGSGAKLTPRVDWAHTSTQFQSIQGGANSYLAPRDLFNAQLRLDAGSWDVTGYITNLTDKTYVVGQTYGPSWFLGRPRQFGVRVGYDF